MSRKSVRLARMGAVFALLLSLMLGVVGRPAAVGAQTTINSDSGVSGSTYTSPSFGYSLEWDRSWDVSDEKIEDEYNMLRLDDAASILYIEGYAPASRQMSAWPNTAPITSRTRTGLVTSWPRTAGIG